jgi:[acyl-carrier-protein] S-malonyltransferase
MIAFTFPGQGSQKPAVGHPWSEHPSWQLVVEASRATGRDVEHLLLEATADELRDTRNAQLTTFVASLVVLDAVQQRGVRAAAVAGHSLGEYTALVASGALDRNDGARLVTERARAMHEAGRRHPGTMVAVLGLDLERVEQACAEAEGEVWLANDNAPGQAVIAGTVEAVETAAGAARQLGAKRIMPVPVSGAFHTPLMGSARDRLVEAIAVAGLRTPDTPVYANVDAHRHESPTTWSELLADQLCQPVRWRDTLKNLWAAGCTTFVELGPGTVLTGLAKRTIAGCRTVAIGSPDDLDRLAEAAPGTVDP